LTIAVLVRRGKTKKEEGRRGWIGELFKKKKRKSTLEDIGAFACTSCVAENSFLGLNTSFFLPEEG
jgi:hypothetical protein